jgi:integrase
MPIRLISVCSRPSPSGSDCRKVKLKKGQRFGFHNFRRGLASRLVNQGTDVKTVQGLLRHSNVKTTLGLYTHQVNSSMLAAQDSMLRALQPGS